MTCPFDLSLISGPVPVVVAACGAAAGLFLLGARRRTWWTRVVPLGVTACGLFDPRGGARQGLRLASKVIIGWEGRRDRAAVDHRG